MNCATSMQHVGRLQHSRQVQCNLPWPSMASCTMSQLLLFAVTPCRSPQLRVVQPPAAQQLCAHLQHRRRASEQPAVCRAFTAEPACSAAAAAVAALLLNSTLVSGAWADQLAQPVNLQQQVRMVQQQQVNMAQPLNLQQQANAVLTLLC